MAEPPLHPRRHVFYGHANGVSVRIRRPQNHLLPVQGCSSLPVTGGLSESNVGPKQFDDFVSFESVATSAHGDYVHADQGVDTTLGKLPFHQAPTKTMVRSDVRGLVILGRVHVGRATAGIVVRSPAGKNQPSIRLDGSVLEGVRIDDSPLSITLAEDFYQKCDTKDKLAARHARGLAPHYARLFLPLDGSAWPVATYPEAYGVVKCTIVREIRWADEPHPTATIEGNVVHVPDLGRIYFGELYIDAGSRRLTMVRFQLGSPKGGEVTAAEGGGGGWPPG